VGFTCSVLAFMASMAVLNWVRSEDQVFGVVVTIAAAGIPFTAWLVLSQRLPHRGSGWRELVPGAVVVAIGVHAFYLFTVWFLGPKLGNATQTYGLLGVVATLLFWLYLVGRLVIGGATMNVALYQHRAGRDG